ncbi:unnamed protein product, partial [Polarella glacialis]
ALIREEGLGGLLTGVGPALVLCTAPAIQFGTAQVVAIRLDLGLPLLRPAAKAFLVGCVSKIVSTTLTYPWTTVKVCLQRSEGRSRDPCQAVSSIYRTSGSRGFFQGLRFKLLQTSVNAGLVFTFRQEVLRCFPALPDCPLPSEPLLLPR